MRHNSETPFDRDPGERPLVKLLLHSESLADGIAQGERDIDALLQLRNFDFAEVLLTPPRDAKTASILAQAHIEVATVEQVGEHWVLIKGESRKHFGPVQASIDYSKPMSPSSRVTWLDFIMARNLGYDWFVVGGCDSYLVSTARREPDITPLDALNRIRILTAGLGVFYSNPKVEIGEWLYYLYRSRIYFPEFQRARIRVGFSALPASVSDQLGSLGQRLGFALRAADQMSFESLKQPTNDTEDRILYHFAYLVMLATGIFDDLAWMLTYIYSLPLKPVHTVLKVGEGKSSSAFLDTLAPHAPNLHAYLASARTQDQIRMFYPLRDRLQHREFVSGGLMVGGRHSARILIGVDLDAYSKLPLVAAAGPRESLGTAQRPGETWIDPHWFASAALEAIAEVVNGVLRRIDVTEYLTKLTPDKQRQLAEVLSHGPHDAGRELWGSEPVFFWAQ